MESRSRAAPNTRTLTVMTKRAYEPTIRTQADLESAWHRLMGPWGYGSHSLWLMVILGDTPIPQLTEIEDCVEPLAGQQAQQFSRMLGRLSADLGPGIRFAMLRSRPGSSHVTDVDRAWARALYDACTLAEVPCEVLHLGTRDEIRPLPPDEVLPATG